MDFIILEFMHIKQEKLDVRVMKCVLIGYSKSVKGSILLKVELGGSKIVVRLILMWPVKGFSKKTWGLKDEKYGGEYSVWDGSFY